MAKPIKIPEIIRKQSPKKPIYHSASEISLIERQQTSIFDQKPILTQQYLPEGDREPITGSDVEFATRIFEKYDKYYTSYISGNVVTKVQLPTRISSKKLTPVTSSKEQIYFTDSKRLAAEYISKKVEELKEQEKFIDYSTKILKQQFKPKFETSKSIDALQTVTAFDSDKISKQRSLEQSLKHLKYEVDSLISPLTAQTTKLDTYEKQTIKKDIRQTTITGSRTIIDQQLISPKLQKYEEIKMYRDNTQQAIEVTQKSGDLLTTKKQFVSESMLSKTPLPTKQKEQVVGRSIDELSTTANYLETKLKQLQRKKQEEQQIDRQRKIEVKTFTDTLKGPQTILEIKQRDVQLSSEGAKYEIYKVPKPIDTKLDSSEQEDYLSTIKFDLDKKKQKDETISLIKRKKDTKTYETYETEQRIDTSLVSKKKDRILEETISKIKPTPIKKYTSIKSKKISSPIDVELVSREDEQPTFDIYKIPKPTDIALDSYEQPSMISQKLIEIEEEKRQAIESISKIIQTDKKDITYDTTSYDIYKASKPYKKEEYKSEVDLRKRIAVDTISKAIKPEVKKFKSVDQIQHIDFTQEDTISRIQFRDIDLKSKGIDFEIYKIPKATSLSMSSIQQQQQKSTIYKELQTRQKIIQKATYEAVVITVKQGDVITTVKLPEFKKYKPLTPIKPKTEDISYSQMKKSAVEFITKTVKPIMEAEKEDVIFTSYETPLLTTTKIKQMPFKEISYTQIKQQPSVIYGEERPDYFEYDKTVSTIEHQQQVMTKAKLPETIKRKPKKEITYSQIEQPLVYEEKRPQFYEDVMSTIYQQGQVVTKVSLPEIQKIKPLTPIKPIKEQITYTETKKLAAQFISKELHPYIEIEKIEQPKEEEFISTIKHQQQVITKVKLPETIKRKPKKEIIYSQIEQPLVYEEKRPQFYEDVMSTIYQQGQVVTKVSLPEIQKIKPLTPIKPIKEQITYTETKKLAAQFISKQLHPYIEIEKIEQPKQYDEVVSTVKHQQQVMTKVKLPETIKLKPKKKIEQFKEEQAFTSTIKQQPLITRDRPEQQFYDETYISTIEQDQILTKAKPLRDTKKIEAAKFISKTVQPFIEQEEYRPLFVEGHFESRIKQGDVITSVKLPEQAKLVKQFYPKEEIMYSSTKILDSPLVTQTVEKYKQTQIFVSIIQQGQVLTKAKVPEIIKIQPRVPVYPKEEISYTETKKFASQYISKTIAPYVEVEKIEQPKQDFDETVSTIEHQDQIITKVKLPETIKRKPKKEIIYSQVEQQPLVIYEERPQFYEDHVISTVKRQDQVVTKVSLPEIQKIKPLTPIKPLKEQIPYTETKKLAAQFISKELHPYIEIEKIEQPKEEEFISTIKHQDQIITKVKLPETIKRKPKKEILYSQIKQTPLVYEKERPEFYEDHVISTIEQGMTITKVSTPKKVKPIQPKEEVIYSTEKKLASQFISKQLHPYIKIEKIEKPKIETTYCKYF